MKREAQKNQFDVIVIGGGASGMMAAGVAAARGKHVLILEKNRMLGEKLKITGGGRCNITNAEFDTRALLKNYGKADQFLFSPFSQFGVKETFSFFENLGLSIVVQARKRAFPATEKAFDVFLVLERYIKKGGVVIKTNVRVSRFLRENGHIAGVVAEGITYVADSYILSTGGLSHPETGSTGDGFNWLKSLGHSVENPTPSIVPLKVKESWVKSLSGISLSFMKITFFSEGVKKFFKKGKVLFTHFGLSGPLILNSAAEVADLLQSGQVTATIDAYPDTDLGSLEDKIIKIFDANKNKMLKNVFDEIAPHGTALAILSLLNDIDPDTKVHSVTKEQRKQIVQLLKALPVTITGLLGYEKAVVADGGVSLKEIDMSSMRSKLLKNLYVTGDLLDVKRPSGGYSLQLCWTTGFVAGSNA
jgi:predicted Rossmann fold flavoprotein